MPGGAGPGALAPSPTSAEAVLAESHTGGLIPATSWLGRKRDAIMGVTPFAATALFFATDHWQWFLAIPAMGAALYTGQEHDGDKDRRRRERDERRRLRRGRD